MFLGHTVLTKDSDGNKVQEHPCLRQLGGIRSSECQVQSPGSAFQLSPVLSSWAGHFIILGLSLHIYTVKGSYCMHAALLLNTDVLLRPSCCCKRFHHRSAIPGPGKGSRWLGDAALRQASEHALECDGLSSFWTQRHHYPLSPSVQTSVS